MDQEILKQFEQQNAKLDTIQRSVEKIRKKLFLRFIINTLLFILPFIGIAVSIPWLIDLFTPLCRTP